MNFKNEAMEEYKRTKEEEALSQKKEEEELLKLHKQEALQLLKKKEKTDNLIKVTLSLSLTLLTKGHFQKYASAMFIAEGESDQEEERKMLILTNPRSLLLYTFSSARTKGRDCPRPGTNNSTVTALISVKWKVYTNHNYE
ncbi:hypothetical protein ISN44_As08g006760 [Arabidopsis suecica]|uniref:Uncharacterized protein n=1 Tax=Arabidopsis suecica TaxID=45249 RepID=A0A8T2B4V9_ARASU|nr:hypothetical protein ISN44_As08g006760 [Arabidopsis suecica]